MLQDEIGDASEKTVSHVDVWIQFLVSMVEGCFVGHVQADGSGGSGEEMVRAAASSG